MLSPSQLKALDLVAAGRFFPDLAHEDDGWHARWRPAETCDGAVANWIDEYVRTAAMTPLSADAEEREHATLHDAWLMALKSRTGLVRWDDAECAAFAKSLADWHGNGADESAARHSIVFQFNANPQTSDLSHRTSEIKGQRSKVKGQTEEDKFHCLTSNLQPPTSSATLSCAVPHGKAALKALGESPAFFGPLRGLKVNKKSATQPQTSNLKPQTLIVELSRDEAESFLSHGARELTKAGYSVTGCDLAATITASAEISPSDNSKLQTLNSKLIVRVAGQPVTAAEIRFLLEQKSSLVFFREHWIEVDRNILKEALRALEKSGQGKLSRIQALAFACGIGRIGRLELEDVAAHGWLRGLLNDLRQAQSDASPSATTLYPLPSTLFHGTLRSYQQRGVTWMKFLTDNGFGALLADDMGLGKTIQTIAWILENRASCLMPRALCVDDTKHQAPSTKHQAPILIVAPLTLLANWRHEFATFAPSLKVYVHQGHDRHVASGFRKAAKESDVVLTSYNLLVKDHLQFGEIAWDALVLDEAQMIKNPDTAVARAVRALTPPKRIALTGTPIENSVADIWSIEEFLNPGFLGERKQFTDRFVKPLKLDPHATAGKRLRHALEPFVLRRLKSDEGVAAELGPKREIREYCVLTPRGRADYEAALEDYRASERRRGDVFALLTRLKLICDGAGKFERLAELLETIYANGESALVFSQYAKIGRELKAKLEERFGLRVPFLHGALTAKQREREIENFNAAKKPTAFVLSLKAGGFGLNLTKATHVIHYDRWWNPAVENQATDRAHRIGQTQTVFVHLLMTAGTVEEHVDEILAHKRAVSGGLVASGEQFLAQLPPELFEKAVSLDE